MPKAVISIVKGGLGNQMFIYAAGRALALRTCRQLYLDSRRGYTHDKYGRGYRLGCLQIKAETMPEEWRIAPTLKHLGHKMTRAWNKILPRDCRTYLAQVWNLPAQQLTELTPLRQRITLNGYWQDEAYFRDFSEDIRRELLPPVPNDERNQKLGDELAGENTVFVHTRRVRYPTLLSADYYMTALDEIRSRVEAPRFVIFSDDAAWTRDNIDFGKNEVQWVEHNAGDEMADLWLMSRCRHGIIANSSFSWWGAWLGGDSEQGRIIYTPDHPDWMIRPAKGWNRIPFTI